MISLRSQLVVKDNSGVKRIRCIRVLKAKPKAVGYCGDTILASVVSVKPGSEFKRGDLVRAVILSTKKGVRKLGGIAHRYDHNGAALVNKSGQPLATRLTVPVYEEIRALPSGSKWVSMARQVLLYKLTI